MSRFRRKDWEHFDELLHDATVEKSLELEPEQTLDEFLDELDAEVATPEGRARLMERAAKDEVELEEHLKWCEFCARRLAKIEKEVRKHPNPMELLSAAGVFRSAPQPHTLKHIKKCEVCARQVARAKGWSKKSGPGG